MKASLRTVDDHGVTYQALMFVCPGCRSPYMLLDGTMHTPSGVHMLPVNSTTKTPQWDWDGNLDAPDVEPVDPLARADARPARLGHRRRKDRPMNLGNTEPVNATEGVRGVLIAVLAVLQVFDVVHLSAEQNGALLALYVAISVALTSFARARTTPTSKVALTHDDVALLKAKGD